MFSAQPHKPLFQQSCRDVRSSGLGEKGTMEVKKPKDTFVKAPLLKGPLKVTMALGTGVRVSKFLLLE